ncbi:MAG: AAA family ATPase [Gammaproteobacteria bacterium]|nr:AAA family ATPase [Gammaproteobacteria bacterium]
MYLEYFNLKEQPFSITPDPRFLYMSARHREALAHLLYGLGEGGGFVQLTGEVGTGKTTICRCLLEQVPEDVDIAIVMNPKVTAVELLATVCDELGINHPGDGATIKTLVDTLNRYLLDAHARGRRTVLIIDEAQNLSTDVLEQIRLLTNLETPTQKLLQIILIGQPELRELLSRENMRQLAQRITARYHLEPISDEEADAYIRHRLQICGSSRNLFSRRAVDRIHKLSGGIPRLINVLCDRSLLGTYVEGKDMVDQKIVGKASQEVLAESAPDPGRRRSWLPLLAGGLVVLLLALAAFIYQPWQQLRQPVAGGAVPDTPPVAAVDMPGSSATSPEPVETPSIDTAPESMTPVAEEEPVAATAAEPAPVSLPGLLKQADSSWYRSAWKGLFARWQVVLPDTVKPDFCNFAREYGLLCVIGRGDSDRLRTIDRPMVLTVVRDDGERIPVLLQGLQGAGLEALIGDETYRLDADESGNHWQGDYVVLVQAPPGGRMLLKVGDRAPDVAWVRGMIEQAMNVKIPSADPALFDYRLQKQVLAFQRRHALLPDGIVGRRTLLYLNPVAGREGEPRLAGGQG